MATFLYELCSSADQNDFATVNALGNATFSLCFWREDNFAEDIYYEMVSGNIRIKGTIILFNL